MSDNELMRAVVEGIRGKLAVVAAASEIDSTADFAGRMHAEMVADGVPADVATAILEMAIQ